MVSENEINENPTMSDREKLLANAHLVDGLTYPETCKKYHSNPNELSDAVKKAKGTWIEPGSETAPVRLDYKEMYTRFRN